MLCFVHRASRYNRVKKTNLMHNLFLVYFVKRYMFQVYLNPSSGGTTVCIGTYYFFLDDFCCPGWIGSTPTRITDSHLKRIISTNCCIHMMGLDTPETCKGWRNTLRRNCASSWFFFTRWFFFFRWRYSPLWALACRTIPLHFSPSITSSVHSPFPSIIIKSIQLIPLLDFRDSNFFYCVGLLAPRQTPNLED